MTHMTLEIRLYSIYSPGTEGITVALINGFSALAIRMKRTKFRLEPLEYI